jgi:hypothetical protein
MKKKGRRGDAFQKSSFSLRAWSQQSSMPTLNIITNGE